MRWRGLVKAMQLFRPVTLTLPLSHWEMEVD